MRLTLILVLGLAGSSPLARAETPIPAALSITPAEFTIHGADNVQRLLISGKGFDYSRQVTYESSDAKIAVVTKDGVVIPRPSS